MTINTEPYRILALGWVLLLGLWFAPATWAGETPPPGVRPATLSAGGLHTCGLKDDGAIVCWGWNGYGQATPPAGTFTQVSAGFGHSCGLKSDGAVACWGWNDQGQATPPAGFFTQTQRGRRAHLRAEERRRHRLLGGGDY